MRWSRSRSPTTWRGSHRAACARPCSDLTSATYRRIAFRTVGMSAAVTVTDALVAFPFAYYMARVASSRVRSALFVAVMLPLWASYLARVYAWLLIFAKNGALNWAADRIGLP